MQSSHLKRTNIFFIVLLGVFAVIIARLAYVQIIKHNEYNLLQVRQSDIPLAIQPETGMILDRNGEILALSRLVNSVYVVPKDLDGHSPEIQQIANLLGANSAELESKIQKCTEQNKYFLWVKRRVDDDTAQKIATLNIKGVGLRKEYKRFYPKETSAAHLIGYRGLDEQALDGMELHANHYLKGEVGYQNLNRDARHQILTEEPPAKPAVPGNNVYLTIDIVIQGIVEKNLDDLCKQFKPAGVEAVVLRPATGEILALALAPSFDPANYQKYSPELRRNHIITEAYEPGSTFKPFIVTAALEKNIFNMQDKLFCENGKFKMGKRTITDHEPFGTLSLVEVVAHSSNIGMAKVGLKTGAANMYEMVKRFGFGTPSGLKIGTEHPGLITPLSKWSNYTMTSVPMGYEISVNTMQLARAYSVFANNGYLTNPQIIKEVKDKKGNVIYENNLAPATKQIISSDLNKKLCTILRTVVLTGTGVAANLKTYSVAGKTGTARKIGPDKKYTTKYRSLFASFAPVEKPEILVLVMVDEPKGAYYAAAVAAPTAGKIIEETLKYLNVPSQAAPQPGPQNQIKPQSLPKAGGPAGR